MKKILVLSACIVCLGISPVNAMMKKPTNVCEFLQYMDTKMDQLQFNVSQRIDQINTRISNVENQLNTVQREVNEVRSTLGCFDNSNANTVPQLHTPVAPREKVPQENNSNCQFFAQEPVEPKISLAALKDLEIRVGKIEENGITKVKNDSLMEDRVTKLENKMDISSNILCETLGSHPQGSLYNKPHLRQEFDKLKAENIGEGKKVVLDIPTKVGSFEIIDDEDYLGKKKLIYIPDCLQDFGNVYWGRNPIPYNPQCPHTTPNYPFKKIRMTQNISSLYPDSHMRGKKTVSALDTPIKNFTVKTPYYSIGRAVAAEFVANGFAVYMD